MFETSTTYTNALHAACVVLEDGCLRRVEYKTGLAQRSWAVRYWCWFGHRDGCGGRSQYWSESADGMKGLPRTEKMKRKRVKMSVRANMVFKCSQRAALVRIRICSKKKVRDSEYGQADPTTCGT